MGRGSRGATRTTVAALLLGCASPTAEPAPALCPAPGPRGAEPPPFAIEGDAARGGRLFLQHCQGCHARTHELRRPGAPAAAPRLDCAAWQGTVDAAYLYGAINSGPGLYGHGPEPPLGEHLAPMDIADLVAYLLSLAAD